MKGRELDFARNLAHGEKRKLELGIMLAADTEVLLLDEPTAGMSSEQVPALLEIINSIMALGDKTIVLVEHRMDMVMSISDRITVMHLGNISGGRIATRNCIQPDRTKCLSGRSLRRSGRKNGCQKWII